MGRKPLEKKRVQLNRLVEEDTIATVRRMSKKLEVSEGRVIDRAVRELAAMRTEGRVSFEDVKDVILDEPPVARQVAALPSPRSKGQQFTGALLKPSEKKR